jgi:hypothetical protein
MLGFDGISVGGITSWLMECISDKLIHPQELGLSEGPNWDPDHFNVVEDSAHNAEIGITILDAIIEKKGFLNLEEFIAGTSPTNDRSLLKIRSATIVSDRFVLEWDTVTGRFYYDADGQETATLLCDRTPWIKEEQMAEGFAKECAVVTHHRLEAGPDGRLEYVESKRRARCV